MTVLLNKWDGQQFENDTRCDRCGKYGTVKKDDWDTRYCKGCLLTMVAEIDRAILADKSGHNNPCRPQARREGN